MTVHPTIAAFEVVDGQLAVGGIPVDRLAERVGSTPFFAYDRRLLTERVSTLRATLPEGVELSYAVKANPMPAIVQHLAALVDSFDVASAGELRTALDTTIAPERVSFAGPGKRVRELGQAIAAGVTIELESENEARRVLDEGKRLARRPRVAVRVNPNFRMKGSGMRMGGGSQQFGVDAEQVPALLGELEMANVDILGFHVFAGSQNLNAAVIAETQEQTVALAIELAQSLSGPLRYLNLGGGFGIPYTDRDEPLDLASVAGSLSTLLETRIRPELPEARVVIELGRYIVGECGVYVARVVDRKVSRGQTFLVVDGGLHHQLAASGNFGQVIRRNYPVAIGNRAEQPHDDEVSVVGCLCTPLDILADTVNLPRADVGDLVVVFQAGAYGLTASPTAFLGHPEPAEVLV
jgi:diaminopimelate decarboxylase